MHMLLQVIAPGFGSIAAKIIATGCQKNMILDS
jgi:hypothetical protein